MDLGVRVLTRYSSRCLYRSSSITKKAEQAHCRDMLSLVGEDDRREEAYVVGSQVVCCVNVGVNLKFCNGLGKQVGTQLVSVCVIGYGLHPVA